jgi:hypothetical protein
MQKCLRLSRMRGQTKKPLARAEREGIYAIMCDCGHIGGDGKSVADAISTWNGEPRAGFDKNPV